MVTPDRDESRRSLALLLADAVRFTMPMDLRHQVIVEGLRTLAADEVTQEDESRVLDRLISTGFDVTPVFDAAKWLRLSEPA